MAEGEGGKDKFDVVLDEAFIAGATVAEPDWKQREAEKAKREKQARRRGRKERNRHRRRRARPVLAGIVVVGFLALVGIGFTGNGPFGYVKDVGRGGTGVTTTSHLQLAGRRYQAGDCVTWDQSKASGVTSTDVIPCDQPHLLEMTSRGQAPDTLDHFPTSTEWAPTIQAVCGPLADAYLGTPLKPNGRYRATALTPTSESWDGGDRGLECAIELRFSSTGDIVPMTGTIDPKQQ